MRDTDKLRQIRIHKILAVDDNGRRVKMRCPFHNERTPSFFLFEDGGYKCFGCGVHGNNVIDFLMETGESFANVIEELKKYV